MKTTRASERYAKSLLTLSIEHKVLDMVKEDVDMLSKSFNESREISNLYLSPIIPIKHKLNITNIIFKGKVNKNTLNLLLNLISRKRDNLIESILRKFNELYNDHKNTENSLITSTFSLDDKTLGVVKDFAEKLTKKKISLVNTVDETIIGGFNLKIGDRMIDCTVSNKLNELRKKLINN